MLRRKGNDISGIPSSRRTVLKLISILLPFILLIVLELLLRLANVGNKYNLFTESKNYGSEYLVMNESISSKYFVNFPYSQTQSRHFPKEKTDDHLRIFVLGSSTAVGFPFAPNIAFPSQLERMLQQTFPHRRVEVINTSISAINSYTLADFTRMLTKYEPDCILFYAGHNEFYGVLGTGSNASGGKSRWIKKLHIRCSDLRTYQLLIKLFSSNPEKSDSRIQEGQTLLQRIAANQTIAFESDTYLTTISHFRKNINQIISICMKQDIPIIVSELVSNVKDLSPFGSIENPGLMSANEYYASAKKLYEAGEYMLAKKDFNSAKELDCIRFRAPEEINQVISEIAREKGVPVVAMVREFEEYAENGIIGKELMTEHVHPNRFGQFLMARAFYRKFIELYSDEQMIRLTNEEIDECYKNTVFTPYDEVFSSLIINNLLSGWPFVRGQEAPSYFQSYQPQNYIDSLALSSILRRDKDLIRQHSIMATHYLENGDSLHAVQEYHACAQLLYYNNTYYKNAIKMLIEMGKEDLAVPIAREAVLRFEDVSSLLFIADFQWKSGQLDMTLESIQKYLLLCKNDEQLYEGYIRIHKIYKALEDDANANRYLQLIMEINPAYMHPKTKEESPKELSQGNSIKLQQAQELLKSQQVDQAIIMLKEIDAEEDNFLVAAILGQVLLANGNEDAYIYLEKVFEKYSKDEKIFESLIIANMRAGKFERANELLHLFELTYPDSELLPEMKALVGS